MKRKYVRVCKVCRGTKEYDLEQTFQGKTYVAPVRCNYCDENGNSYDNRRKLAK